MNRKDFLKISTLSTATVVTQACLSIKEESKPKFKKALKFEMIRLRKASIYDKFRLAKDIGFDGIEIIAPSYDLDELRKAQKKTGLKIHGLVAADHWSTPLSHPSASVRRQGVESLKKAIIQAHQLGASSVSLIPGVVNSEISQAQARKNSLLELRKVLPLAEELCIKIAFTNVWNGLIKTPQQASSFIEDCQSSMAGMCLDIGNSLRHSKSNAFLEQLKGRIFKLDVKAYSLDTVKKNKGNIWKGFDAAISESEECHSVAESVNKSAKEIWLTADVVAGGSSHLKQVLNHMNEVFDSH